jgi:hypothetical protein
MAQPTRSASFRVMIKTEIGRTLFIQTVVPNYKTH